MVVFSLTVVRHGESVANKKKIIQGQKDTQLSDIGRKQAELIGTRLRNEKFTHVFASDLQRAALTAKAIVDASNACVCEIIHDLRLRERKFGCLEGKSVKEMLLAAENANQSAKDFIPVGAESIQQVRSRARGFFSDLCAEVLNFCSNDQEYEPGLIRRRQAPSASAGIVYGESGKSRQLHSSTEEVSAERESKRRKHENSSLSTSEEAVVSMDISRSMQEKMRMNSPADYSMAGEKKLGHVPSTAREMTLGHVPSSSGSYPTTDDDAIFGRLQSSSSSGYCNLQDNGELQDSEGNTETGRAVLDSEGNTEPSRVIQDSEGNTEPSRVIQDSEGNTGPSRAILEPSVSDNEIKTGIAVDHTRFGGCPNVSLSPLVEHRLSRMSSGRNSSFDDADNMPPTIADVLVVSHGGVLKELLRHFVEDLKCKIPGSKGHIMRVTPNTGLSKFTVSLEEPGDVPVITCLLLHDKDHLVDLGCELAEGTM